MSGFGKLNQRDFFNGLIMAVGGAVYSIISQTCPSGQVCPVDWTKVRDTAISVAALYLIKNLFTTESGATLGIKATEATPKGPNA